MSTRTHVAWLLWCANQGYLKPEDRKILRRPHLFEADPETLHPIDLSERRVYLQMADEVLAAIEDET